MATTSVIPPRPPLDTFQIPFEELTWRDLTRGLDLYDGLDRAAAWHQLARRMAQAVEQQRPWIPPEAYHLLTSALEFLDRYCHNTDQVMGYLRCFKQMLWLAGEMAFMDENHRRGGTLTAEREARDRAWYQAQGGDISA